LAEVHPRFHTPSLALVVQAIMAIFLLLGGGAFTDFLALAIFAEWIFYMVGSSTIFVFRKREPDAPRAYRAWGYPLVPALFIAAAAVLLYYTFTESWRTSWVRTLIMVCVLLAAIPVFQYFASRRKPALPQQ